MRHEVLRVTAGLMMAEGVAAATVFGIARRAGVSNATIYREWPNRNALLADAFTSVFPGPPERCAPADPYTELVGTLLAVNGALESEIGARFLEVQVLLPAGEIRDAFVDATLGPWLARMREIWRAGVAASLFDGSIDECHAIHQLVGPILISPLLSRTTRSEHAEADVARRVDLALHGLRM